MTSRSSARRTDEGARSLLTLLVRAAGPARGEAQLGVRSQVIARAPLSTTMADPVVREVGLPMAIAPQRWHPGFLYANPVPIRKRPGTEVFHAYLAVRKGGAVRPGARSEVEVLRLP